MRKLFLAALLAGGAAVPAQAGLFIELTGSVTTYSYQVLDGSYTLLSTSSVSVSGYCGLFCDFTRTPSGFSLGAGTGHGQSLLADFRFDEMPGNIFDGAWHAGSGSGLFYEDHHGSEWIDSSGSIDRARLTIDDYWTVGWEYPTYSLGERYGVPEPATWAMMIGGFALAGAAMRRRSYRVAFG